MDEPREVELKVLTVHLKYAEHIKRKKQHVAKISFRGKNPYLLPYIAS